MAEEKQNNQSDFMIEKIKDRPVNKKKLLKRTVTTASMAVIFGLIACLTFLILEPVFSNWLYPEEEPNVVVFPEESQEMAPEDMLVEDEDPSLQDVVESVILEDEQLQKILDSVELDKSHYQQLTTALSAYIQEKSTSMVTVTGIASNVDWLNDIYENEGQTYGVIVANNGKEYLILTNRSTVMQAESLRVTFCDNTSAEAVLKQTDRQTGLAIVAVQLADMSDETRQQVKIAALGTSNLRITVGTPVVALGCPMGDVGSAGYGILTTQGETLEKIDSNYKLYATNIYGSTNALGVLFNLQGQIFGIITSDKSENEIDNAVTAIGISELRKLIENMSNGRSGAYMGVSGMDVTAEANREMGVPFGAYVRDIEIDSPAMLAGLQKGDVIVEFNGESVENFSSYTAALLRVEAGDTITVVVQRLVQDVYRDMEIDVTLGTAR